MKSEMFRMALAVGLFFLGILWAKGEGTYSDRVLLRDIEAITLYSGQYTNARRGRPIPQLNCVGGTAGCSSFVPTVVQCYNRGSDGYDIQWECKSDMDQAYRFGELVVSCEGYDYPDDPFILRGSCGLEYKLYLTDGGYRHHQSHSQKSDYYGSQIKSSLGIIIVVIGAACVLIYVLYNIIGQQQQESETHQQSSTPPPPYGFTGPPPPGFRPEYMPSDNTYCRQDPRYTSQKTGGEGGFWTGAATGGALGYLFGSRNSSTYRQPGYTSVGSGWQTSGSTSSYSSGHSSSESGTRVTSGFGVTRRR